MTSDASEPAEGEPPRRQDAKNTVEPSKEHDRVARKIVDSAFAVHATLGPGLLESVYEQCLVCELASRHIIVERQIPVSLKYRNVRIDAGFRMDLLVASLVVVEIKAIEKILPVHEAQLLTYLKLSGRCLGMLINFNVARINKRWPPSDRPFLLPWRLGALAVHWQSRCDRRGS